MPAVNSTPVVPATLPTLSQIRSWDTTHLKTAAQQWTTTAEEWEDSFSVAHRSGLNPGGTDWHGEAAEATQARSLADLYKVRGLADTLDVAAKAARTGASDLEAAKQQVLDSVLRAEEAGFDVHDDLSLASRRGYTAAEYPAKLAEGQALSAELKSHAAHLLTLDAEVAGKITAAAAPLGEVSFPEAPMDIPAPRDATVQAVDFKQGPNVSPTPEPDGAGGSGSTPKADSPQTWQEMLLAPGTDPASTPDEQPTLQDALFPGGEAADAESPKNLDEAMGVIAPGFGAASDQQRQAATNRVPSVQELKADPAVVEAARAMLAAQGVPPEAMDTAIDSFLERGHHLAEYLATAPKAEPTGAATVSNRPFWDSYGDRLAEHKENFERTASNLLGLGALTEPGAPGVAESWKNLATGIFDNPIADPKGYAERYPDEPALPRTKEEWARAAADATVFAGSAALGPEALAGRGAITHELLDSTPAAAKPMPSGDLPVVARDVPDAPAGMSQPGTNLPHVNAESGGKGAWNAELNNPAPNTHYTVDNRFHYNTDDLNRVNRAYADLDIGSAERNGYQQRIAGGDDRLPGDQGGHIFGSQFGGPGEAINLTAMRDTLNSVGSRDYYNLESQWRSLIDEGKSVSVDVEISYPERSMRPDLFSVKTYVDGKLDSVHSFRN